MKPNRWTLHLVVLATFLACLAPACAATVTGTLDHASVVWIKQNTQSKSAEFEMRNRERQFLPALLIIHTADSVRFPIDDPFYHSIYFVTTEDPFDIGD